MKKKKQRTTTSPPPPTTTTTSLNSLIHDHGLFFDKLVELIPAKFYLSNDDDSKPWYQGLSKAAKASAKQQTKQNIKQARRDRLDPNKSHTTLDILNNSILIKEDINPDGDDKTNNNNNNNESVSVTYEELQQRLRSKLEELKANRGQGKRSMIDKSFDRKRKRGGDDNEGKGQTSNLEKIEKEVNEATKGIEFGKLKIENEDEERERKKKKGNSKAKELERAKRLEELKKDPERGEVVAQKHSWKAAASRAMGVKVHDDARILKESIKKEKKRHEKNAGKWKERVESREKLKSEKQEKRSGNIAERAQQKKARKIAKREKKLMRPGFEGRREGYINEKG